MKKNLLICLGFVLGFLVLSYAFVPEVLGGKIVNQSDISGWQGMSHEKLEWERAHPGQNAAWTGSMFSGMPTASIQSSTKGDWTQNIYDFLLLGKRPATYLFISLLGAFLMMLAFGLHPLVAAAGAIAVTFCSYNIQIIQVGHNTKMQALAFLPWVFAALVFTYSAAVGKYRTTSVASLRDHSIVGNTSGATLALTNRSDGGISNWVRAILGAALFGLAVSFQVKANHPQISYYLALMILIYVLVLFISLLRRKHPLKGFWIASALLLVMGVAGIGTNAVKLLPTWEYTPYSMRGGSSDGGGAQKGLDIDYATAWSYGWEELPNLAIPNYNGGASSGELGMKSETVDLLRRAGQGNLQQVRKHLPLYWGPQPFTAGPMYMGAVTIFLFILGLMYFKGKEKWWAVTASLLAVLLALGSHLLWFTKLFFAIAPLYNKFRTVSMALVMLQFTLPVLGFMALDDFLKSDADVRLKRRRILTAGSVTAGLLLLLALLQSVFGSFTGAADAGQPDVLTAALAADRHSLLWSDTLRSILLVAGATAILVWGAAAGSGSGTTIPLHPQGTGEGSPGTPSVASLRRGSGTTGPKQPGGMADGAPPRNHATLDCVRGRGPSGRGREATFRGGAPSAIPVRSLVAVALVGVLVLSDLFLLDKRYLNSEHFTTPKDFGRQFSKRPVDEMILADTDPSYRVLDLTVNVFNDSHPSYWHKNIGGYSPAKLQRYQEYIDRQISSDLGVLAKAISGAATVQEAEAALPYLESLASLNCRYIIVGGDNPPLRYPFARGNAWWADGSGNIALTSYAPDMLEYSYSSAAGGTAVFSEVYYPAWAWCIPPIPTLNTLRRLPKSRKPCPRSASALLCVSTAVSGPASRRRWSRALWVRPPTWRPWPRHSRPNAELGVRPRRARLPSRGTCATRSPSCFSLWVITPNAETDAGFIQSRRVEHVHGAPGLRGRTPPVGRLRGEPLGRGVCNHRFRPQPARHHPPFPASAAVYSSMEGKSGSGTQRKHGAYTQLYSACRRPGVLHHCGPLGAGGSVVQAAAGSRVAASRYRGPCGRHCAASFAGLSGLAFPLADERVFVHFETYNTQLPHIIGCAYACQCGAGCGRQDARHCGSERFIYRVCRSFFAASDAYRPNFRFTLW